MKRLLIIEDDATFRDMLAQVLRDAGYEVLEADNGVAGAESARRHLPDVIVSDVLMDAGDGFTALAALRKEPSTATIPFIFMTALGDKASVRHGMELGADDYLIKPFALRELVAAVELRFNKQRTVVEQAEKKLEDLKLNLSLVLPHELRTPLIGILGFAAILAKDASSLLPAQVTEMAQGILTAGERLYRLIENFMLYAQLELLKTAPEDLAHLKRHHTVRGREVVETIARKQAQLVQRAADLTLELAEVSPAISRELLSKLVEELVDNAFKFSLAGAGVRVTLGIEEGAAALCVADHGRGMKPEEIAAVGAYVQFNRSVYEQQGTGLGLALAKRLAELHDGSLSLTSQLAVGTTVTVRLPLAPPAKQAA